MSTKVKFTLEQVTEIIMDWAEGKKKNNEIEFDRAFCKSYADHNTVRYWTTAMTKLIPDNSEGKNAGFDNPHHYAFEIECKKEVLHLLIAFSYTDISDETKKICEEILEKYRMYNFADPKNPTGNFRRVCSFNIDIKKCVTKDEIITEMDKFYYRMKGYEEFIIFKLKEAEKV